MRSTEASRVRVTGPLEGYAPGFCEELAAQGFTDWSAAAQLRLMAHVSGWLGDEGLDASSFTSERVDEFLAARRQQGYTRRLTSRAVAPLVDHLRAVGAVPPSRLLVRTGAEQLVDRYCDYLLVERGLAVGTVGLYADIASRFLADHEWSVEDLNGLEPGDVTQFVVGASKQCSVAWAKNLVTGLRSFLRYLFTEGLSPRRLDDAVPSVAGWQMGSLPLALAADEVQRLVRSCDRGCAVGRRDYAILVVLSRLGLRAGEVAGLALVDVEWRNAEIVVRGKSRREERLPLPVDVGEALVAYLRDRRPDSPGPEVFQRVRAPQGPLTSGGIRAVVYGACDRAGLARVGPQRLRHTTATEMLRNGSPLAEVAQVLRHRSVSTTAIYAKVDRVALVAVAQPWPGSDAS